MNGSKKRERDGGGGGGYKDTATEFRNSNLKKCTERNPIVNAVHNWKKLTTLFFFQKDRASAAAWPIEKCMGVVNSAETKLKYINCAKCGETVWASFAPGKHKGGKRMRVERTVSKGKRHHNVTKLWKSKERERERQKVSTKHYTPIPENKGDESNHNYEVRPKWCNKLPLKLPESWDNLTHLMREIWKRM